jgi:hypothetical protein
MAAAGPGRSQPEARRAGKAPLSQHGLRLVGSAVIGGVSSNSRHHGLQNS